MNKNGKVLLLTIVIGLACGILLWYGSQCFLDYYLKPKFEKKVQTILGRNVTVEEMGYRLHLGIYIKNLAVFAKDNQTVNFIINAAGLKFSLKELFLNKNFDYDLSFKSNTLSQEWIHSKGSYSLTNSKFDSLSTITLAEKPVILKISSPYLESLENISFSIGTKEALLKGKISLKKNTVTLHSATLSTGQSALDIAAQITDLKTNPVLNAEIQGPFEISDIKKLVPPSKYSLADNLLGKINTKIELKCPVTEIKKVTGSIKFYSKQLTLKNITVSDIALQGDIYPDGIRNIELASSAYEGKINAFCDLTYENKDWIYKTTTSVTDLNIKGLASDILRNGSNISGTLNAQMELSGNATKRETIKGSGWFLIADGLLKEVSVLGEMADILNTPQLKRVRFEEAKATFTIADEKIITKDLQLNSPQVILRAKGYVDFEKRLNFDVTSQMAKEVFDGDAPQKLASLLILSAGSMMGDFTVTGTIEKPQLKIKPVRVEKTIGQVFQFLQDIQKATSSSESALENDD